MGGSRHSLSAPRQFRDSSQVGIPHVEAARSRPKVAVLTATSQWPLQMAYGTYQNSAFLQRWPGAA